MTQAAYAPCPKCGSALPKKVGMTWWGGAIGPRLFSHVKCTQCGTAYNGKSGRSNQGAITVYLIVSAVIVGAIAFFYLRR